jgi:hypothetical protein
LLVPLLNALVKWQRLHHVGHSSVCLQLLDALLQFNAKVPADVLMPMLEDETAGNAAFVLLLRGPRRNEADLLRWFRQSKPKWNIQISQGQLRNHAVGNVLCASRTPGFATSCWLRGQLDLDVVVITEPQGSWSSTFLTRDAFQNGAPAPPLDFPRNPLYQLVQWAHFSERLQRDETRELLAKGCLDVGVVRWPSGTSRHYPSINLGDPSPLDWLHQLAKRSDPAGSLSVLVEFKDGENYLALVAKGRARLVDYRTKLLQQLIAQHALTTDEARDLAESFTVHVRDLRVDDKVSLPELPQ